jgi:hypothetical protein
MGAFTVRALANKVKGTNSSFENYGFGSFHVQIFFKHSHGQSGKWPSLIYFDEPSRRKSTIFWPAPCFFAKKGCKALYSDF